ncbi:F0F1 ATP synthase subunit B [Thermoflavimicrobium dichotomicum]|uniref:ATP synthase subunit b n=1 Tax=Thermoflavimicrobium dichotomicum TaxID=46223 RepID=A0A1I3K259_9BACL|nr:F0F1 ATP synthase subunit B [Thermoflavimicrobium dichotomicum]SFI66572.1 F-type H+-transporting ATPase subunit b [Thermoflavimicrobium dichotomicum]
MISFTWGTILAQLVIFIILMLLVSKYALRPLLDTMKKRQDYIDNQIITAEKSRQEAEELLAEQKALLKQAQTEAKELIERAKAQKEKEAEKIILEAKEQAERMIQEAKLEIEREREKAIAALRDEVGALTVQLASKLLEKELDEKGQSKLVDRYFEQVGRLQ